LYKEKCRLFKEIATIDAFSTSLPFIKFVEENKDCLYDIKGNNFSETDFAKLFTIKKFVHVLEKKKNQLVKIIFVYNF
jgi:hypothetical protein